MSTRVGRKDGAALSLQRVQLVVFVLYVMSRTRETPCGYVQTGFEGISNPAQSVGNFFTWLADQAE